MNRRVAVLLGIAVALIVLTFAQRPIAQPQAYHHFADGRTLLGIPRALNVLSNVPFLVVGLLGVLLLAKKLRIPERNAYLVLFIGVTLTCFGSAYYHADPSNARLIWDRLPMTLGFMGLFTAVLSERVSSRLTHLLLPLLALGIASVAYWAVTERRGAGDLRLYLIVQFLPLLLIPLILWLFPPKYGRTGDIVGAIGFYGLAKVLELFDAQIYAGTAGLVSGHTLKHLAAATAAFCLLRMLRLRQPVAQKAHSARV